MGVFHKNNLNKPHGIIDCICRIPHDGRPNSIDQRTVHIKSIWGANDGKVTKIWERDNESLPQFLMISSEVSSIRTMYVSDDLINWTTLGSFPAIVVTSPSKDGLYLETGNKISGYQDIYIGSMRGTYYASMYSKVLGYTIGKLSKIEGEWKWITWNKVQDFITSSLIGIFDVGDKTVIFINAKTDTEQTVKHLYYSTDSGNTWTKLLNVEIDQILQHNGYLLLHSGPYIYILDCSDLDNWTTETVTSVYPGVGFPTNNAIFIVTDARLVVYGRNALFMSSDNGKKWTRSEISSSSLNWLRNIIVSTAYGHGVTFANMYMYDCRDKDKIYYLYSTTDCINWALYPPLSGQISCFLGEQYVKIKSRKLYYFDAVDKFVCTGIYNNTNPIMFLISINENGSFSYSMKNISEENPRIIQNRY